MHKAAVAETSREQSDRITDVYTYVTSLFLVRFVRWTIYMCIRPFMRLPRLKFQVKRGQSYILSCVLSFAKLAQQFYSAGLARL